MRAVPFDGVRYWCAVARQRLRLVGLAPAHREVVELLEAIRLMRQQEEELRPTSRPREAGLTDCEVAAHDADASGPGSEDLGQRIVGSVVTQRDNNKFRRGNFR